MAPSKKAGRRALYGASAQRSLATPRVRHPSEAATTASRDAGRPSTLLAGRVTRWLAERPHQGRRRGGRLFGLLGLLVFAIASLLTLRHSSSPEKTHIGTSDPDYPPCRLGGSTSFNFGRVAPIQSAARPIGARSGAGLRESPLQKPRMTPYSYHSNSLWAGPQYSLRGATSGLLPR